MKVRERGSALIIVTICLLMIIAFVFLSLEASMGRHRAASVKRGRELALEIAEAGVALRLAELRREIALDAVGATTRVYELGTMANPADPNTKVPSGTASVAIVDASGNDGLDDDYDGLVDNAGEKIWRITSTATVGRAHGSGVGGADVRAVEVHVGPALHPLFFKSIYAGNKSGSAYTLTLGALDGSVTSSPPGSIDANFDTRSHNASADYVEGDVFVNGNVAVKGGTNLFGNVDATGTVTGGGSGDETGGRAPIAPPDLSVIDYDAMAQSVVSASGPASDATVTAMGPGGMPPFIAKSGYNGAQGDSNFGSALDGATEHSNYHFMLGNYSGKLDVPDAFNSQVVVVKGNLWLHRNNGLTFEFLQNRAAGTTLTIVVEGNVYVADDFNYTNAAKDGLLIIAKSAGESYTDVNGNHKYDAGEPILNDAGAIGTYEGPKEGQGNVYFGDPAFGTGGVTSAFMFAENNVYLKNQGTPPSPDDRIWGVDGFLNAGNQIIYGSRNTGTTYDNYRVRYDDRIQSGTLKFKGMPKNQGGGVVGVTVLAWREVGR